MSRLYKQRLRLDYNYERFRVSNYEYEKFPGPKAGEIMQDFTLHGLDGKEVKLSDYRGKWMVIETGSSTHDPGHAERGLGRALGSGDRVAGHYLGPLESRYSKAIGQKTELAESG